MISESELVERGLEMSRVLQSKGLLTSMEMELHEKGIVFVLSPTDQTFERVMRLCLNFLGARKRVGIQQYELFYWCATFVESEKGSCRIWVDGNTPDSESGFQVILELITLGLQLSHSLSDSSYTYSLDELFKVYRTKEEVLSCYAAMVSQIIRDDADLPTTECKETLSDLWLCCPKHRLLFVQRLLLVGWLHYLMRPMEDDMENEENEPKNVLVSPPSLSEFLAEMFAQTFTPQAYLEARFAYAIRRDQEHWDRRTQDCRLKPYLSLLCCPFHICLEALWYLFSAWLVHFDDIYQVSQVRDQEGDEIWLTSLVGTALFIRLAGVDMREIPLPQWLSEIDTCQRPQR